MNLERVPSRLIHRKPSNHGDSKMNTTINSPILVAGAACRIAVVPRPSKRTRPLIARTLLFVLTLYPSATLPQENRADTNASPAFAHELMQSMESMDKDMMAAPMIGHPDHDFCAMMIPHHQGAVDMSKAILLHGKDPVVRRLAQEIIVTQLQEIEVMRLRLAALQTDSAGVPQKERLAS